MGLDALRRWQWMLVGVGLGMLIGWGRGCANTGDYSGTQSMSQSEFEVALRKTLNPPASAKLPALKPNIVVERVRNPEKSDEFMYAVRVMYFPGTHAPQATARTKDGKIVAIYKPYVFLAKAPYKPLLINGDENAVSRASVGLRKLSEKLGLREPDPPNTVLDYLDRIAPTYKLNVKYAWWMATGVQVAMWGLGGFVVIGLIWPTLVNMMTLGRVFRPREEKGVDLSKVRNVATAGTAASADISDADMAALLAMEEKLEESLKDGAVAGGTAAGPGASVAAGPVRKLTGGPVEAKPDEKPEEKKDYDRREGDYYPVARKKG